MVEARGIEPLSEKLSTRFSTSVVGALGLSLPHAHRRAYGSGSLKIPPQVRQACGWFPTLMTPVSTVVGNYGRTVGPLGRYGHIAVVVSYI